jgi:acetolactate synthase-1/2/3 large subunit
MTIKGMTGAEAVLRCLRRMGVERIFASPGSEWAALWEALARPWKDGEIPDYLSTRHEETAVAMAVGYAKSTGKLPAVIIHTTVGSLHGTMAMRQALHERIPMVILAGESIGFGEYDERDPGPQWHRVLADVGGPARLVEPVVKWSFGINLPDIVPDTIQRACQIATASPRGPVFCSVPMEYLFATMRKEAPAAALTRMPEADETSIREIADALAKAKRPVIIAEDAGESTASVRHLVKLAERLGAPVVEAWHASYVNFPRIHPLYAGAGRTEHTAAYLKDADFALMVDCKLPWHPPSRNPNPACRIATIGEDPFWQSTPYLGTPSHLVAAGNTERSLERLAALVARRVPAGSRDAATRRWGKLHEARRAATLADFAATGKLATIETRWVAHELNEVLPANAMVVNETITHRPVLAQALTRMKPGHYYESTLGGLGMGTGVALGVKAAYPERPVILTIGDGSFNYNPITGAFGVCQEHGLPILVVLFDNAGYLSQRTDIMIHFPKGKAVKARKFTGTSIAPRPDYAMLMQAYGGHGEAVERPADVRPALLRGLAALKEGRPALIDMRLVAINGDA